MSTDLAILSKTCTTYMSVENPFCVMMFLTYLPSGQTDFSEIFESYLKPVWARHVSEHLLVRSDQFFPYLTNLSPPLAPCDIEAQHGWPWLLAMKNH